MVYAVCGTGPIINIPIATHALFEFITLDSAGFGKMPLQYRFLLEVDRVSIISALALIIPLPLTNTQIASVTNNRES
jgi:hypothetical protein